MTVQPPPSVSMSHTAGIGDRSVDKEMLYTPDGEADGTSEQDWYVVPGVGVQVVVRPPSSKVGIRWLVF